MAFNQTYELAESEGFNLLDKTKTWKTPFLHQVALTENVFQAWTNPPRPHEVKIAKARANQHERRWKTQERLHKKVVQRQKMLKNTEQPTLES